MPTPKRERPARAYSFYLAEEVAESIARLAALRETSRGRVLEALVEKEIRRLDRRRRRDDGLDPSGG